MLILVALLSTFAQAAVPADVTVTPIAVTGSSQAQTASDLIAALRKTGAAPTLSGTVEQFDLAAGRMDLTGFGTCAPSGPGDYLAEFDVIDPNSGNVAQHISLENRGCQADAPAQALDRALEKFGLEQIEMYVHLGTETYWFSSLSCRHDTSKSAQAADSCYVSLNTGNLTEKR
jgi:hypothetical protein